MNKSLISKINLSAFCVILISVFTYIIYKAIHVPITHDELGTIFFYSKFSYWEIMMYPDTLPNNHILNTLLTKPLIALFGIDEIVLRTPNILSFLLYGAGIYRLVHLVLGKASLFYIPAVVLFLMNPYLLDFFGLCRGYGMSIGFMLLSLSYLISSFKQLTQKHLWYALILACCASYANFTLLIYWVAVCLLILCFYILDRKRSKSLSTNSFIGMIVFGVSYFGLIIIPILKMGSDNQFRYWTSNGFIDETVTSLVHHAVYESKIFLSINFITYFIVTISCIHVVLLGLMFIKSSDKISLIRRPEFIATAILVLSIVISILQCWILKTPNLNSRIALFYYPLFIVSLITMNVHFTSIHRNWIKLSISIIISFFGIHHLFHTATPMKVREWNYDAHTIDALNIMKKHSSNQPFSISTYWLFNPSFHYYTFDKKNLNLLPYNKEIDPELKAHYFYIHDSLSTAFDSSFVRIKEFDDGNIVLFNTKINY
jgi:hypothetical protein